MTWLGNRDRSDFLSLAGIAFELKQSLCSWVLYPVPNSNGGQDLSALQPPLGVKKAFLYTLIISVVLSSILGVIAILGGTGQWFELKVFLTTLTISGASICGLSSGALLEKRRGLSTSAGVYFNTEIRESVYLPNADLILFNNFTGGRQIAYDPTGNRWVTLNIAQNLERLGTVSDTLTWDAKRGLVWNLNAYKAIYVLRPEAATLGKSDH